MWKMKDNEQTMLFFIFHIDVNHLSRLHFYKNTFYPYRT